MVTTGELRTRVEAEYAALDLPSWPDPWPDGEVDDAAYSRLTDPDRYRVLGARAHAWVTVLREDLGVRVETWDPAGSEDARFDRGTRLVSPRPGTLPLLLLWSEGELPMVEVRAGAPARPIELLPGCGCDACDSGSADLLRALDEVIEAFVQGPYVMLRGPGWSAAWHPEGGQASGLTHPDFGALMETCRRLAEGETVDLPRGTRVAVNQPWAG